MSVKIRLQRKGRKRAPYYHIVAADSRSPRDGKFIERLGFYNPTTIPATIELDREKAFNWIMEGAQPTDTVAAILRYKGVMYRKHLQLGVKKGALPQEKADEMLAAWIDNKEGKITQAVQKRVSDMDAFHKAVAGTAKVKVKPEPVVEAASEETSAEEAPETPVAEATEGEAPAE